ncbi:endonuclease domain-containing protein [Gulosibacter bifidus]
MQRDHSHPCRISVDPLAVALAVTLRQAETVDAVIAVDALRNGGLLESAVIARICERAGLRGRKIWQLSDAGAGSGIETLFRLWLVQHRVRFRTQVPIPGIGIVDFLIGNVIVEVDGFEFHGTSDRFHADRARDLALKARGYRMIRLSYRQVMFELDALTPTLLDLLR